MEGQVYECPGCFSPIPADRIDFQTKRATCPYCGNLVVLTRKSINTSQGVLHDLENAVRFFIDNNFDSAKRYAESLLSVSVDNAVGLFIIAHFKAFKAEAKSRLLLDKFFKEELPEIDFDTEELESFTKIILHVLFNLADYEKEIVSAMVQFLPKKELGQFIDAFSPYLITKRSSINWFDAGMKEAYKNVTMITDVPKTWYALFQAMLKNPDSPEVENNYYLKTKAERFYNEYVLGIGEIFSNIGNAELKNKFNGAYEKKAAEMKSKIYK